MTIAAHLRSPSDLPADAWRYGILWPVLHADQRKVYWAWRDSKERFFVLDVARRWGKSFLCLVAAHEEALRRPGAQTRIPYAAKTQLEVREVMRPICEWLWQGAPESLRPKWHDGDVLFSSGARIVLAGVDMHPDRLRGPALDFAICDEVAFWQDCNYVIKSILLHMAQGRPWARFLLASTPPVTPAHAWTTEWVPRCKTAGAYAHRTIEDNPLLTEAEREFFVAEAGGRESTMCRRELYAEHVLDDSLAIVPEFRRVKDLIVREHERPAWFDGYVSLDPGWTHHTACLFGYWDFAAGKLVIEDEFCGPRINSRALAEAIREKEAALWSGHQVWQGIGLPTEPQPHMRVSDTDLRLIGDLWEEHGLKFYPTAKDDRDARINALRLHIQNGQVIIHPRCKNLIAHLEFGVWNKQRTQFAEMDGFGHFDAVAALVYLTRNVDRTRNPFPPASLGYDGATMHIPAHLAADQSAGGWEELVK